MLNISYLTGDTPTVRARGKFAPPASSCLPSPTRRCFSPAWSHGGWLILLSPCSVIQIWKVNNKLTSLRLYAAVTHSFGYRTCGSMRAPRIPWVDSTAPRAAVSFALCRLTRKYENETFKDVCFSPWQLFSRLVWSRGGRTRLATFLTVREGAQQPL